MSCQLAGVKFEALPAKKVQSRLRPSLALLAVFVMVWTLYGLISAAPAAIHNDTAEAYVWGREFQLGYAQHPPFWAWIAGLWFEIFPRRLGIYSSRGAQCWPRPLRLVDAHRRLC